MLVLAVAAGCLVQHYPDDEAKRRWEGKNTGRKFPTNPLTGEPDRSDKDYPIPSRWLNPIEWRADEDPAGCPCAPSLSPRACCIAAHMAWSVLWPVLWPAEGLGFIQAGLYPGSCPALALLPVGEVHLIYECKAVMLDGGLCAARYCRVFQISGVECVPSSFSALNWALHRVRGQPHTPLADADASISGGCRSAWR